MDHHVCMFVEAVQTSCWSRTRRQSDALISLLLQCSALSGRNSICTVFQQTQSAGGKLLRDYVMWKNLKNQEAEEEVSWSHESKDGRWNLTTGVLVCFHEWTNKSSRGQNRAERTHYSLHVNSSEDPSEKSYVRRGTDRIKLWKIILKG